MVQFIIKRLDSFQPALAASLWSCVSEILVRAQAARPTLKRNAVQTTVELAVLSSLTTATTKSTALEVRRLRVFLGFFYTGRLGMIRSRADMGKVHWLIGENMSLFLSYSVVFVHCFGQECLGNEVSQRLFV